MFVGILKKGAAAALAAIALAAPPAQAQQTVQIFYKAIVGALDYGQMGYVDESGRWVSLVGQQILGARAEVRFDPQALKDVKRFHMAMLVPVEGARSELFVVDGTQFVPIGDGRYYADITSNLFNGRVRDGRFSIEVHGQNARGETVPLNGTLSSDTGFHYIVTRP